MEKFVLQTEITLLKNVYEVLSEENCHPLIKLDYVGILNTVISGQYERVFSHHVCQEILNIRTTDRRLSRENTIDQILKENVQHFLSCESNDESILRQLIVLTVAISCLQLFVQNNYVGPPFNLDSISCVVGLPASASSSQELKDEEEEEDRSFLEEFVSSYLSIDGEYIYPLSSSPFFLAIARILLCDCSQYLTSCKTAIVWLMRCHKIHQDLLEDKSATIKTDVLTIIAESAENELFSGSSGLYRQLSIQFHLEVGHLLYFYYEDSKAEKHFNLAKEISGLSVQLTGALGKRTKFQEKDFSQLILKVTRDEEKEDLTENERNKSNVQLNNLPKNVPLDDDSVLDNIQFREPDDAKSTVLTALDQTIILGLCHHHRRSHEGQGRIVEEECLAYVNCVLSQPCDWSVQSKALMIRARWETETSRHLRRSVSQLEELVEQFSRITDATCCKRLPLVYAVSLSPHWTTKHQLGSLLMNVGATAAALDIYLQLQMWEDVIKCYVILGHLNQAEKLINDQLAVKETVSLWCYRGDVTHNPDDYTRAWELSKGQSSRAQRSLAYLHLRNHEHEKSLPFFEKSLEINSLQIGVWYTYGCTCLSSGFYDKASKAFRRCVLLNDDNFEAWNNLATSYIKANDKPRAFLSLQDAIRCDYENWRIWENYLLVSVDVGEFEESMRAYHRMIDLRHKHVDVQVLSILVRAIAEDMLDGSGQPSYRLRDRALTLFGHVTSTVTNNGDIWRLYAQLIMAGAAKNDVSQSDVERAIQYTLKSYKCLVMDNKWNSDLEKCKDFSRQILDLTKAFYDSLERLNDGAQKREMVNSGRMVIKSLLARIEKTFFDPLTNQIPDELNEILEIVKSIDLSLQKFLIVSK